MVDTERSAKFPMDSGNWTFAKKFGGTTGNDPDFFKVTVKGYKGGVLTTDSVPFYLADFRFANNALDYIVDSWLDLCSFSILKKKLKDKTYFNKKTF